MGNKRRILTLTLLIAILGAVSWLLLSPPGEPVYQGKPLSYWCYQYEIDSSPDSESQLRAETAIRAIGTNAIPTLLRWLKAKDSKLKLLQLASKQHSVNIRWKTAENRHYEALQGFFALGTAGKSAVPALIEIYSKDVADVNSDHVTIPAILIAIGPAAADAIPLLVQGTKNTNYVIRWGAVYALGNMHTKPDLVVPVLTQSMRDPARGVRKEAAIGLRFFGSDAKSAVPDLLRALADPSPGVRDAAATALKKIDPEAAAKAGVN